jgi:hypothetical protein
MLHDLSQRPFGIHSIRILFIMRLLNVTSLEYMEYEPPDVPAYAAASHRWRKGDEATFKNVKKRRNTERSGYIKVQCFCDFVRKHLAGIEWLWTDTCCIKHESSQELHEAINSMFSWYQSAVVCLCYLADVTRHASEVVMMSQFERSVWFTRGWTLQELIAPRRVLLLSKEWRAIGNKGRPSGDEHAFEFGIQLPDRVAKVTRIPEGILAGSEDVSECNVENKLRWRGARETTKPEDRVYCMFGLFGVHMPLLYGEGEERVAFRLEEEIAKVSGKGTRSLSSSATRGMFSLN